MKLELGCIECSTSLQQPCCRLSLLIQHEDQTAHHLPYLPSTEAWCKLFLLQVHSFFGQIIDIKMSAMVNRLRVPNASGAVASVVGISMS
jgi:hypothetical protein